MPRVELKPPRYDCFSDRIDAFARRYERGRSLRRQPVALLPDEVGHVVDPDEPLPPVPPQDVAAEAELDGPTVERVPSRAVVRVPLEANVRMRDRVLPRALGCIAVPVER
jgi:hypothetical protein